MTEQKLCKKHKIKSANCDDCLDEVINQGEKQLKKMTENNADRVVGRINSDGTSVDSLKNQQSLQKLCAVCGHEKVLHKQYIKNGIFCCSQCNCGGWKE